MRRSLAGLAVAGLMLATVSIAQPAPWYRWKSTVNGATFCAQTSPGEGWVRDGGPYRDARCQRPVGR